MAGALKFICHRASCGFKGVRFFVGGEALTDERHKPKDRRYTGPLNLLPEDVSKQLLSKYGLGRDYLHERHVRWAPDEQRLYIPTPYFDQDGGGVLRSLVRGVEPKVKSCKAPGTSGVGFYEFYPKFRPYAERTYLFPYLLVVEDALSALCASEYGHCVSLQGTYLSQERLLELIEYADGKPIVLALDKDATDKAVGMANKYKYLADIYVLPLPRDIKDMTVDEREEILWSIKF